MMHRFIILFFLFLVFNSNGIASQGAPTEEMPPPSISIKDFKFTMTITPIQENSVYAFLLPDFVYEKMTGSNFEDVRLFNQYDKSIPFWIENLNEVQKNTLKSHELSFIPYSTSVPDEKSHVETVTLVPDAETKNLSIKTTSQNAEVQQQAYFIDNTKSNLRIEALHLISDNKNYNAELSVYGSDDLTHWEKIKEGKIVSLLYETQLLENNTLQIGSSLRKYYKIVLNNSSDFKLNKLVALTNELTTIFVPPERQKESKAIYDSKGDYVYEFKGAYPVHRVQVILPDINQVSQGWLFLNEEANVFFRLMKNGEEFLNPEIRWPSIQSEKKFYIIPKTDHDDFKESVMRIYYTPHRLVFLARGGGPFKLAFGNSNLTSSSAMRSKKELSNFLELNQISLNPDDPKLEVKLADLEEHDVAQPEAKPNTKKWILWGILILGVGLLTRIIFSLRQEFKNKTE